LFGADGAGLADGVEAEDDGADCDAGEFGVVWVWLAGGRFDFSLGDCAHAPVPSIKPMAVVINKCRLMFPLLTFDLVIVVR
jgi:hypothetical protein